MRGQPAGCDMHEEDGGMAAEGITENWPVEKAAAESAAGLSVVSNPVKTSIPKEPAFPHSPPLDLELYSRVSQELH